MPAAVAVPAIIGGGAALGGAAISARAAGKAADKQIAAANQSTALSGRIYDEQKGMLRPYIDAGTSSLSRLMDGYWNNRPYGMGAPSMGGSVPGVQPVASPFARAMSPQGGGQGPAAGGGVLMRAPTGETRMIPAEHVQRAEAAGAMRVQ